MRIKLRVRSPFETLDGRKYLVYIDTSRLRTVQEVENHIQNVLDLEGERIQLLDEDCIIPSRESSGIFLD